MKMNFEEDLIKRILQGVADCHSNGVGFKINLDYVTDCTPHELKELVRYCYNQDWIEGHPPIPVDNVMLVTSGGRGLKEEGWIKLRSLQ